jgi:hypothetical protein
MMAEGTDRGSHLRQVGPAAVAADQVELHAGPVALGLRALEVVGHELDHLPAGERGARPADQVR